MPTHYTRWLFTLAAITFSSIAQAHPGHGSSPLAGIVHPLLGLDHLLAMVAVGAWAYQLGGRARWLMPVSFVAIMAAAGSMAMAGMALPAVESGVAASVLLLGLLIACAVRVPPAASAAIVALFAVFHGSAHGAEMPQFGIAWQYGLGFALSTAALHGLGLLIGRSLDQRGAWLRAVGVLIAASGGWMIAGI